jgi:uncharacterized protein (DUF885 family)
MSAQEQSAAGRADAAFDRWLDRFFAHYYAARPVNASFIGVHDHDHALPDFSAEVVARQIAEMRDLRSDLTTIATDRLDTPRRHDALIADGFLELQLMEDGLPQFHRGNPAVYTGEAVFAVLSLFLRDAEPFAERVAAAIARMSALPEFLAQARLNVMAAPLAWTEQALREARAGAAYFGKGLPRLAAERQITSASFTEAAEVAAAACEGHAHWLETTLRQRPTDGVACGREAFDRYLARGHLLPLEHDAAWLIEYAARALDQARTALVERAAELDSSLSWQEQLARLADHHPTASDYSAAFSRTWEAAKQAALDADLIIWPDYPIEYVPVPKSDREAAAGLYYLPYRCPAPFGRPEIHRCLVPPLPPDAEPEAQLQRLRTMNDAVITLNYIIHHGGLGHHVENWHAFRAASRLGQVGGVDCASRIAIFAAGTLVEGWACYATDLMEEIGFLTPRQSLAQAHGRLRMAARAVADVALHTGARSLDETAAFYEREAGMAPAAAHGEVVKNSMFPGAAMMYLVGTNAVHDLRRQIAKREGSRFNLRGFHDRFLRYGAIPVTLIAEDMLRESPSSRVSC